jgi:hypothetical protein
MPVLSCSSGGGKSRREIMRCLKRYVAREVYGVLTSSVGRAGSSADGDRVAAVTGVT